MREIGTLPEEDEARNLADHLLASKITSKILPSRGGWAIWVYDENRLAEASRMLDEFRANPGDPKFLESAAAAASVRREAELEERRHRKQTHRVADRWEGPAWRRIPATCALIVASVLVTLGTDYGNDPNSSVFHALVFSDYGVVENPETGTRSFADHGFGDILRGQVWRLITPIFLHLSIWHLVGNMSFLFTFGGIIESRKGLARLLAIVAITGVFSCVAQFAVQSMEDKAAIFGGMSGVGFGLSGYLWTKGNVRPDEGLSLSANNVLWMFAWFFLCASGAIGPIANVAHLAGLIAGMTLGLTRL